MSLIYYKTETHKNFNSLIQADALTAYAKKKQMTAVGIADLQAMFSVMDFYHAALTNGIKPIISLQMKVFGRTREEELYVTFVAKNYDGYLELVKLLNKANMMKSRGISYQELPQLHHVVATVSLHQVVEHRLVFLQKLLTVVEQRAGKGNFWLELEPAFTTKQKALQQKTVDYAKEKGFPVIAAPTVRYYEKKQAKAMDILLTLRKKRKDVERAEVNSAHFLTEKEEEEAFRLFPDAVEQTHVLANMCCIEFPIKGTAGYEQKMPVYEVPKEFVIPEKFMQMFTPIKGYSLPTNETEKRQIAYLSAMAWKGFVEAYRNHPRKEEATGLLKKEIGVVMHNVFTDYFLHVARFYRYAAQKKLLMGPGRGSVAGSLLARCLNIIDVDPVEFDLLFERFMNELRMDAPDIDIDISKRDRPELVRYARELYGVNRVGKVVTFNPYGGKRAIVVAAKEYGVKEAVIEKLKASVDKHTKRVESILKNTSLIEEVRKEYPNIDEIIEVAIQIQEVPNSRSVHNAAIVLSKTDLQDEVPIDMLLDKELNEEMPVIQFTEDSKHLEALGYTKIDFLSLPTLDVIQDVKNAVIERDGSFPEMPLEDKKVFETFQRGELVGVFQLGSEKMCETAIATKPETFRDIINLSALYRPGGKDEIPHYIENRRKKNRIVYDVDGNPIEGVEELENILHRTYGIIVYQEQIMKIAQVWSGYDLGEADVLRRAVSKKKRTVLEEERKRFVASASAKKRNEEISNKIYDLIVRFADYGFNESHAVVYGKISYEMAYLKTYYPLEFMSALISSVMDDTVKAAEYVMEARRMGLHVQNPSIMTSQARFVAVNEEMLFGLPMIKDVSADSVRYIVEERAKRPFLNFTDFMNRMHSLVVNKKIVKALIAVGAFDMFGNQSQLLELLEQKTEPMKVPKGQALFTDLPNLSYDWVETLPSLEDIPLDIKVKNQQYYASMTLEKSPMEGHQLVYRKLLERINKNKKMYGGVIVSSYVFKDSNKRKMAYLDVQGTKGEAKVVVFANTYEKVRESIGLYRYILFAGKYEDARKQYVLNSLEEVNEIKMMAQYPIEVAQKNGEEQQKWMERFESILAKHQGEETFDLTFKSRKKTYSVDISDRLLRDLADMLKEESIAVEKVR